MKKILLYILVLAFAAPCISLSKKPATEDKTDGIPTIKPTSVEIMPDISMEEYEKADTDYIDVYSTLYWGGCSWYCAGKVDTITASSCHKPEKNFTYNAQNAHDFNHESVWATDGSGIGEYIVFSFPGNCPRITSVAILNGHVKSDKSWRDNSRVKSLLLYYNDQPYKMLELQDSRSLQFFDLDTLGYGPDHVDYPNWTLKFEIKEVYPGQKYEDCVIADFIFDGIDHH